MVQARLDHRPARHPAALPVDHIAAPPKSSACARCTELLAGYHNRRRWTDDGAPIDTTKDKEPGNHE